MNLNVLDEPNAKELTKAVLRFASANQMESECLFHDFPVWKLSWRSGEQFDLTRVNLIQLCLYLVNRDQWISFMPSYHLENGNGLVLAPMRGSADKEILSNFCGRRGVDEEKLFIKLCDFKLAAEKLIYERLDFVVLGAREH